MSHTCRQCRAALYPYVRRELTPNKRRFVAQHLETCTTCYAEYRRIRAFEGDLGGALAQLGVPSPLQLAHVWAGVQTQIAAPNEGHGLHFRMRYGAALALLVVALVIPWLLHHQQSMTVPLPPTPQTQTQLVTHPAIIIAMATPNAVTIHASAPYTEATPAFARNDAPDLSATQTP